MSVNYMKISNQKEFYFLPLGGSGEIGMNLNLYAYEDEWLMVDLGISFSDSLGIEVIMPNPQFIVERRDKLKALILTHAHEDHLGAVPYLWPQLQCPIYATPFTAHLLRNKLQDAGLLDQVKIIEMSLESSHQIGPFHVKLVSLTHSIPEPNGLLITTPAGSVFHTGDWKIDPEPLVGEKINEEAIQELGNSGVLAMVCDSTNALQDGTSGSEKMVRDNLVEAIANHPKGRVIVTCFASNVARLESVAYAAQQNGRKVVLSGRSFVRMNEAARATGYLKNTPAFISAKEAASLPPEKVLYISTGSQGEKRAALYRIAENMHPEIKMEEGDTVIFSSRMIPGNEKSIGLIKNKFIRRGINVMSWHHYEIHVSGHPAREELRQMYSWIKPRIAIPVHGELRHMVEHGRLAKACGVPEVIIPENGTLIRLAPDPAGIVEEVPSGKLALDGTILVRLDHPSLKDRMRLSGSGAVFISVTFDENLETTNDPQVEIVGLINTNNLFKLVEMEVKEILLGMSHALRGEDINLKAAIGTAVRRLIYNQMGKKPMVVTHVTYL